MTLLRLIFSPQSLPRLAVRDDSTSSIAPVLTGWFLLAFAAMNDLMANDVEQFFGFDMVVRRVVGNAIVAAGVAVVVVLVLLLIWPIDPDRTTERSRAYARVGLLAPWCGLAPAWLWAGAALAASPDVASALEVPLAASGSLRPLLALIGSSWLLAI